MTPNNQENKTMEERFDELFPYRLPENPEEPYHPLLIANMDLRNVLKAFMREEVARREKEIREEIFLQLDFLLDKKKQVVSDLDVKRAREIVKEFSGRYGIISTDSHRTKPHPNCRANEFAGHCDCDDKK